MTSKTEQTQSNILPRSKSVLPLTNDYEPRTFPRDGAAYFGSAFDDMRWLPALNDDMKPSISKGDALLVNPTARDVESAKVFVLNRDNELQVRRLFIEDDGRVRIRKDAEGANDGEVVAADAIDIVGRVVFRDGTAA